MYLKLRLLLCILPIFAHALIFGNIITQREFCNLSNPKDFGEFHLTFGAGYYWLYIQSPYSTEHNLIDSWGTEIENPIYKIRNTKRAGYFVDLGISKGPFTIVSIYKRWKSNLDDQRNKGGIPESSPNLCVNCLAIKGEYSRKIIGSFVLARILGGGGIGWGQYFLYSGECARKYAFEPSFSTGVGINLNISNVFSICSDAEYEMLHFNSNPSFILDNWSFNTRARIKI